MKLPRRRNFLHLAAGAASMPAMSQVAWAQAYPSRPVRIELSPLPRVRGHSRPALVGQSLSERLGQPFVVENRPGGGGNIARKRQSIRLQTAIPSRGPDGRTQSTQRSRQVLNFNLTRDIVPVAGIFRGSYVVVVNPSVPAKTIPEFISYSKSNAGKINMASVGRHHQSCGG